MMRTRALAITHGRAVSGAAIVVSAVRTTPVTRTKSPSADVDARAGAAASARRAGRPSRYARADLIVTTLATSPLTDMAKVSGSIERRPRERSSYTAPRTPKPIRSRRCSGASRAFRTRCGGQSSRATSWSPPARAPRWAVRSARSRTRSLRRRAPRGQHHRRSSRPCPSYALLVDRHARRIAHVVKAVRASSPRRRPRFPDRVPA